ncbi:MAG: oligosaccharide flippase family protein [Bdellovibrionales bacterium]|nr:oligosaccharide flippase family protein [Bdellovibrionales bacterium]
MISTIMIIQNIIFVILSVLLAIFGYGIVGQAGAYVFSLGLSFGFLFLKTQKELSSMKPTNNEKKGFSLSLKEQRTPQFVANLCGRASLLLDNLIISAFLGARMVTAFYLTQRLINIVTQQLQQVGNSTWPAMSELYFTNDTDRFKERVIEVTQVIAFICGLALTPLCFLNESFVTLWTGANTFAGQTLTSIVIYNAGLIAIITFWQWCFAGTGLIRQILPCIITQAVVNVSCSLLFTKLFGLAGPVLGTLISFQLITLPWQAYLMNKIFEVPILPLMKAWIIPFALPVISGIVVTEFIQMPEIETWAVFMIGSITVYILCAVSFLFLLVPKTTRVRIVNRIHTLLESRLGKTTH